MAGGTLVAAAGLLLAVTSPWTPGAIAAFVIVGAGLAAPLPALYGIVGRVDGADGGAAAVSRFVTLTYTGILLAPALIGWSADVVGLTSTMAGLVPLLLAVSAFVEPAARSARPLGRPAQPARPAR